MNVVVVYESMYGNTHLIAEAVAAGISQGGPAGDAPDVVVVPVQGATPEVLGTADLLVVGGPTHVHGMSSRTSRKGAVSDAAKPDRDLHLDPDAEGPGLREWFESLDALPLRAAAFDTRLAGPPVLTGRASKGIAKRLRNHGCELVVEPESFLVTKENHLADDEQAHAQRWGTAILDAAR